MIPAKRSSRAVTVSHDEPPFAPSGLYGYLAELHELKNQLEATTPGLMKTTLTAQIIDKAEKTNVLKDIGMADAAIAADEEKFLRGVDKFLHSTAGMPQPLGLRTFGKLAEPDKILLTILQMLLERAGGGRAQARRKARAIARTHDLHMSNDKAAQFGAEKAAGYGLSIAAPAQSARSQDVAATAPAMQQVQGVKLEKQAAESAAPQTSQWGLYAAVFGSVAAGVAFELALAFAARQKIT